MARFKSARKSRRWATASRVFSLPGAPWVARSAWPDRSAQSSVPCPHRPFPRQLAAPAPHDRVQGSGKHPLDVAGKRDTASRVVALDQIGEGHEGLAREISKDVAEPEAAVAAEEAGDQGLELAVQGCQRERIAGLGLDNPPVQMGVSSGICPRSGSWRRSSRRPPSPCTSKDCRAG